MSALLSMTDIKKGYPGVQALKGVSLNVRAGEVLALMGENGAGKSTLIKILAGAERADSGTIAIDGTPVSIPSTHSAMDLGIAIIYQEFNLLGHLNVAENILIGHEPAGLLPGSISTAKMRQEAQRILDSIGAHISVDARVSSLSVAQQQMVEIAKAISRKGRIIAMDEPSATLTEPEIERLFALIQNLRASGVGIIYISHRIAEVERIADRVTVLRDGEVVGEGAARDLGAGEIVRMMVGRPLEDNFPKVVNTPGEIVLDVRGLSRRGVLTDIGFHIRAGEVVALAGLVGSGRTEVARCIFGADRFDCGEIRICDKRFRPRSPRDAIRAGIGLITEDRKQQGLVLAQSVRANETLASLGRFAMAGIVNGARERSAAQEYVDTLGIRTPTIGQRVGALSGGNQQKVVLAKWLITESRLLIMDEPTRGIDVGAKVEIYHLMNKLTASGVAILMISSDLPEVLGMADRIVVMRGGAVAGELNRAEATAEAIGNLVLT